ncbi:MAG: hypothetical protein J6J65_01830 [Opitutales bacterium]|jgi:hypothetical protein|nr:hypothetical protein [Opitutales bacterium]
MFWKRRQLKVPPSSKSVRSKDPLYEFKKATRGEVGRYDMPGELWRGVKKLSLIALMLIIFWFVRECFLAWNIFGA